MSTRAVVTINGSEERARVAAWAQKVDIGTVVEFRKKSRSTEQSSKMWAMLGEVSAQVEWYGQKIDAEDWKDIFTASLRHARVVPGIDKGTFVPLGMRTSSMTIDEMSNLIELIYAFGSDPEHYVVFKEPQEQTNSNPAGDAPSDPAVDGAAPSASESDGEAPASSLSPLYQVDLDWLVIVARMLWAATPDNDNTEANLDLLNNQRIAIDVPAVISKAAREKAGSIYRVCKECILNRPRGRGIPLAQIAGIAGCTEQQIAEVKS